MLSVFIAIVAFAFIIFLLNIYINNKAFGSQKNEQKKQNERKQKAKKEGLLVTCPLCSSSLLLGEDLISRVYRPMNVPDQLCTISGCPHCYPKVEQGLKRICPVCHKEVSLTDGHLVARLFNKSTGKKHVIVTGCNKCCRGITTK